MAGWLTESPFLPDAASRPLPQGPPSHVQEQALPVITQLLDAVKSTDSLSGKAVGSQSKGLQ